MIAVAGVLPRMVVDDAATVEVVARAVDLLDGADTAGVPWWAPARLDLTHPGDAHPAVWALLVQVVVGRRAGAVLWS